jgi:hypothetical protein
MLFFYLFASRSYFFAFVNVDGMNGAVGGIFLSLFPYFLFTAFFLTTYTRFKTPLYLFMSFIHASGYMGQNTTTYPPLRDGNSRRIFLGILFRANRTG